MIITLRDTTANNVLTAILNDLAAGAAVAAPYISLYTATKPAGPDTAITTQTLLGTVTCTSTVGTVATRALTFAAITQDSAADADGTAAWARMFNRDNVAIIDVDISTTTGSAFMKMNTTTIVAGGPIVVNSCVITA